MALELDVAALSLVNALASFTTLDGPFKVMLPRNAACVEALLGLTAVPDCAENLGSAWLPVLRVASRVAHLRLLTTGHGPTTPTSRPPINQTKKSIKIKSCEMKNPRGL